VRAAGYGLARWWDCSIAGAMALVTGILFLLAFLCSPKLETSGRIELAHQL